MEINDKARQLIDLALTDKSNEERCQIIASVLTRLCGEPDSNAVSDAVDACSGNTAQEGIPNLREIAYNVTFMYACGLGHIAGLAGYSDVDRINIAEAGLKSIFDKAIQDFRPAIFEAEQVAKKDSETTP